MYAMYKCVKIPEAEQLVGTGWLPPLPDLRDYTDTHPEITEMNKKLRLPKGKELKSLPATIDLRSWCSPIENQKSLGSCTAHAAVGIVEYFQRRAFNKHLEGSRLFIYKTTRNLMQVTGDAGAWLRNTIGALTLCGVPDEKYWPYTDANPAFDNEPPSFVYAIADNYEAVKYFCHDPLGENASGNIVLNNVKKYLAAGVPSMFGFWGFPSFDYCDVKGGIPYPCPGEQAQWGHAIVAVGYDDGKKIKNTKCNKTSTGAILIRNSWGKTWGDKGYGWLPYEYAVNKLALDFWSLLSMEWVDTKQFGL
ncbi:MAG: cysteine protease [Desulfobacterales bacterium CG07_land_8_20_14_0_80_52_14]|nr:MAG: cysteine protease [Desulfobacterales bacterium CG07_land_8_20_14_0_80_52_14]